jgi:hypothetical protein
MLIDQGYAMGMHKLGTGERGTVAGKEYLHVNEGKMPGAYWVYCDQKLYLRRPNEDLNTLHVYSPETLQKIGTLQLVCSNACKESVAQKFNRNMPLLTDGETLYAVVVTFKTYRKKL